MKIATWNVNLLGVRLPQVLDWLAAERPDIGIKPEIRFCLHRQ
jgi:exodeoxyribonuclease-3